MLVPPTKTQGPPPSAPQWKNPSYAIGCMQVYAESREATYFPIRPCNHCKFNQELQKWETNNLHLSVHIQN